MKNYLNKNWPLLILPFVIIPFIILIFYILGGGKAPAGNPKEAMQTHGKVAVNYNLPEADRTIGIIDKMESVQSQTQSFGAQDYRIEGDASPKMITFGKDSASLQDEAQNQQGHYQEEEIGNSTDPDVPDQLMSHIRKQEVQVKLEMRQAAGDTSVCSKGEVAKSAVNSGPMSNSRQQSVSKTLSAATGYRSTGIEDMDELFDRSLALARQNDSLKYRLQEANLKQGERANEEGTRNYTLDNVKNNNQTNKKLGTPDQSVAWTIPAEIYETTSVLTGNRVKIRLLGDSRLNGQNIPRNTFVYGICRTDNERLQIEVLQIQVGGQFIPVKITVFDLDGLPGLYVPDNASRKITKEAGGSINTSSMVGFTGNPLAYAGVQAADRAAKTVLQVIKQKKVTIKKNTLVYLINKNK